MAKKRKKTHYCGYCGRYGATEIHHIFNGPYRNQSDENDFIMEVCPQCHRNIHSSYPLMSALKKMFQLRWENEHSHEEWMKIMGRSWI